MALVKLLLADPETIGAWNIKQIVSAAGDGRLRDGSDCSKQLRTYLQHVPFEKISRYTSQCLSESFDSSGQVLQDLVNELGRRLGYIVENGLYAGRVGAIGNDGFWESEEGDRIVVEVKTSDAYRMSLDTVAKYRDDLHLKLGGARPSILIVVGRQDTGELEAQVRGSRHAWDIRLISVESLAKLVSIKEESGEVETGRKVRSLLRPIEYTRVDQLVDVVFAAATDAATDNPEVAAGTQLGEDGASRKDISLKRSEILAALTRKDGVAYVKQSRAMWWSSDQSRRVVCTVSKRYKAGSDYWYAYHPKWDDFLGAGTSSHYALGCVDLSRAFVLPLDFIRIWLPYLDMTEAEKGMYWHIKLDVRTGEVYLRVPGREAVNLEEYALDLQQQG